MKNATGAFEQSYNAQIAVDSAEQIIVAADVTACAADSGELLKMEAAAALNLGQHPKKLLADAGYKSEANFVGWLTCLQGDARARYSGWMFLYWQLSGEVSADDRKLLASALEPGPRRDIDAISERLRRGRWPLLQQQSWKVYDQYLKANRVEAGVRSYGLVVTLILRAQFDEEWRPKVKER